MKKAIIALVIAVALMLGTGCTISVNSKPTGEASVTESPSPQMDDVFVQTVREEIPALRQAGEAEIVESGKAICAVMVDASPLSDYELYEIAKGFSGGTDGLVTVEQSAYFMGAAVVAFCPEIEDEIADLTAGQSI